ncbi:hypothetical protein ACNOYE_07785 [Nannocystaceae bacterium ST9]
MQVKLDNAVAPATQTTPRRVLLDGDGVDLVIEVAADEELTEASLSLIKATTGPEPTWSAPVVGSDKDGAIASITWVSLDWGSTRTIEKISLKFPISNDLAVRVKVAIGASQWYSPPGPTMAPVPNAAGASTFVLSFPDTTADRVMIEFVAQVDGAFKSTTLTELPSVEFGPRARDPVVAVQAKRAIFSLAGEPAAPTPVPKLIESLADQKLALLGPTSVPLVVRAGSAGNLDLTWNFVIDHLTHAFGPPIAGPSGSIALSWGGEALFVLYQRASAADKLARIMALDLTMTHVAKPERLILYPALALLDEKLGELIRPLCDSAQRFDLAAPEQLTGVSLWVRPLAAAIELMVSVHVDEGGSPAAAPLIEVPVSIAEPGYAKLGPRWLEVDFPAPVPASAGNWVVVRSLAGELSWLVGRPKPSTIGALRHRRNSGAWLDRTNDDADGWALLRVRSLETGPIPAPTIELRLLGATKASSPTFPLTPTGDAIHWTPATTAPAVSTILLHVASPIPSTISLSGLTMRWRAVEPSLGDALQVVPIGTLLDGIGGPKPPKLGGSLVEELGDALDTL